MTKAEIVANISNKFGVEKAETQKIVEEFMNEVKGSLSKGENVYLRGFGSFVVKPELKKLDEISQKTQRLLSQLIMFLLSKLLKLL